MPWILCRYGWEEYKKDKRIYCESTKRGPKFRTTGIRVRRPVYGK